MAKAKQKIYECEKNGLKGWQVGKRGECFVGNNAKQKAIGLQKQMNFINLKQN